MSVTYIMVACHCSSRSHGRFTACAGVSANYYLSVRLHPARCADDLLLVSYVYDFTLDGVMVLRRSDVSELESDKTDLLQTQILKDEGVYSSIDFNVSYDLNSWRTVFLTLGALNRFTSIEDENPEYPLFYLGEVLNVGDETVSIIGFSGAANWDDEPSEIAYEDISCVQSGNNYTKVYERYFERNASTKPSI